MGNPSVQLHLGSRALCPGIGLLWTGKRMGTIDRWGPSPQQLFTGASQRYVVQREQRRWPRCYYSCCWLLPPPLTLGKHAFPCQLTLVSSPILSFSERRRGISALRCGWKGDKEKKRINEGREMKERGKKQQRKRAKTRKSKQEAEDHVASLRRKSRVPGGVG